VAPQSHVLVEELVPATNQGKNLGDW